jgi:hypothetical protein
MLMLADSPATRAWFVDDFVPEVIDLVLGTWKSVRRIPSLRLEQRITNLFSDALERAYERQGKRWFLVPDMKRTDPKTGKEIARHDIRFFHRNISGQRLYFIFECKRLNVLSRSGRIIPNSSSYVAGMTRFVSGKYSAGHPCGGMIGYVMNGDVLSAVTAVKLRIAKRRGALRVVSGTEYSRSPSMPKQKHNGETKHHRSDGEFVIYHLMLPLVVRSGS